MFADDFVQEIFGSLKFFVDYIILCKPSTRSSYVPTDSLGNPEPDFRQAFGVGNAASGDEAPEMKAVEHA